MSRPRKSTTTLKLHGGYRKDRHGEGEPSAVGELICPKDFDENAQWFWDQHTEQVKANGGGGGDLGVFIQVCISWSAMKYFEAAHKKNRKDYRLFCMWKMETKAWATLASKLGLSPTERAKLRITPPAPPSKLKDLLKRKRG